MLYLLGGSLAVSVAALATLAVYMIKLSRDSRRDLLSLVDAAKVIGERDRDIVGYRRTVEELRHAIEAKKDQIRRERAATRAAASAPDTVDGAVAGLLSEMPTPPGGSRAPRRGDKD